MYFKEINGQGCILKTVPVPKMTAFEDQRD
jgi:hypothetical protein